MSIRNTSCLLLAVCITSNAGAFTDDDLIQMTLREAKRDLSRETIEIPPDLRPTHNPQDKITPVTDQTLARPPNPKTQTLFTAFRLQVILHEDSLAHEGRRYTPW